MSTTLPWCQRSRCARSGSVRQIERFVSSRWPARWSREELARSTRPSPPRRRGRARRASTISSRHSTMKVRGPLVERVGVHLEQAVLVLLEDERERVERQVGAEPARTCSARQSIVGWKCVGVGASRTRLLTPSAARTRSASGERRRGRRPRVSNAASTPSAPQRVAAGCCSSALARRCPQNPWPVERTRSPRTKVSMSVQYAKLVADLARSSRGRPPRSSPSVSSEKTTPQPNVSSAPVALEDRDRRAPGSSFFIRMAK